MTVKAYILFRNFKGATNQAYFCMGKILEMKAAKG